MPYRLTRTYDRTMRLVLLCSSSDSTPKCLDSSSSFSSSPSKASISLLCPFTLISPMSTTHLTSHLLRMAAISAWIRAAESGLLCDEPVFCSSIAPSLFWRVERLAMAGMGGLLTRRCCWPPGCLTC